MTSVLVMAGGTGGHVFPALAVARALRARQVHVIWLGTGRGLEARVVPAAGLGIDVAWIDIRGVRRAGVLGWLLLPFTLTRAMWQALKVFRRVRPQAAMSFGGFVAAPGGLVAWLTRTPLVIHEQNAVPGMTNRWLAPLARAVLCGFPGAFGQMTVARHVGNPVRAEIRVVDEPAARLGGRTGPLRLLVVGGSQGARVFNEIVPQALRALAASERPEVRHQCGRGQQNVTQAAYADIGGVRVDEFIDDMAEAYSWADLVLCRAGAMTVAELAAAGVAAVLVPFPHAVDDHQTANARYLAERGGAMLLPQGEFSAARLAEVLGELAGRRETLVTMAAAARACDMPDAVDACVTELVAAMEARHA